MRPIDRQFAQCLQRIAACVESCQCVLHGAGELFEFRRRALHAEQGRIGGFGLRDVLARGLAQLLGAGFDIEDVVAYLKSQSQRRGEVIQALLFVASGSARGRSHSDSGADQRPGLQRMQAVKC